VRVIQPNVHIAKPNVPASQPVAHAFQPVLLYIQPNLQTMNSLLLVNIICMSITPVEISETEEQ
jgi:hypothetical protein